LQDHIAPTTRPCNLSAPTLLAHLKSLRKATLQVVPPKSLLGGVSRVCIAGAHVDDNVPGVGLSVVGVSFAVEEHAEVDPDGEAGRSVKEGGGEVGVEAGHLDRQSVNEL
jgi:hypothetical protein